MALSRRDRLHRPRVDVEAGVSPAGVAVYCRPQDLNLFRVCSNCGRHSESFREQAGRIYITKLTHLPTNDFSCLIELHWFGVRRGERRYSFLA
jgi:hypothetical protein